MKARVVLLGPPASGKGTLAQRIRQTWQLPATSTGSLLRRELREDGPLAGAARPFVDRGELVPDDLVIRIVEGWLGRHGCERFLFDGFPRTEPQAARLDTLLAERACPLDAVLLVDVPDAVIRDRVTKRLTCPGCGAVWREAPGLSGPGVPCPNCATPLERRSDDTEAALGVRLEQYHSLTEPLVRRYRRAGILFRIDGQGTPESVFDRVRDVLEAP